MKAKHRELDARRLEMVDERGLHEENSFYGR